MNQKANRLINSNNPYLLQHAYNPVDWYPWGEEALQKAKNEDKPIFLSIGYSTCYWCHVAERELFNKAEIAALMNNWFINIKVDREERPDIDAIYMQARQIITGIGGWPNNVFLTPDLKPFYAGGYFPAKDIQGQMGFSSVLKAIFDTWNNKRALVESEAKNIVARIQQLEKRSTTEDAIQIQIWIDQAINESSQLYDELEGGFGQGANRFPRAPLLGFLLSTQKEKALEMAIQSMLGMAYGGITDHLTGGFHRYSTEPSWSIPHFEKMLYDNAQLLGLYAKAYQKTKKPIFKYVIKRTAEYLLTEMQSPVGTFYSAEDAEVDEVEGASYLWHQQDILKVLGKFETEKFLSLYSLIDMPVVPKGHKQPEGQVLRLDSHRAESLVVTNKLISSLKATDAARKKLLAVRNQREQPSRDDKVIIADNALAIIGFAEAGKSLDDTTYKQIARRTALWLWQNAFDQETKELKHQFYQDQAGQNGFLDDYALLGLAFVKLHQILNEDPWLDRAEQLAQAILRQFRAPSGALISSWDTANLIIQPPANGDSVKPSGESAAVVLFLELALATNNQDYAKAAQESLLPLVSSIKAYASEWGTLLAVLARPEMAELVKQTTKPKATGLARSADYVKAEAHIKRNEDKQYLIVNLKIASGYHINANPASKQDLIATELLINGNPVAANYPESQIFSAPFAGEKIAVYQGSVKIIAEIKEKIEKIQLKLQACNDNLCLAPSLIDLDVN